MTKTEKLYRVRRLTGLGVSILGFLFVFSPLLFGALFNDSMVKTLIIVGYVLGVVGILIYLKAFVSGLKYAKSKEYKNDLSARQPWEQ